MPVKKIKVELDFDHGDEVFLKTDAEGLRRIVVEIKLLPGGTAIYSVACGDMEPTLHYACELTDTKPLP